MSRHQTKDSGMISDIEEEDGPSNKWRSDSFDQDRANKRNAEKQRRMPTDSEEESEDSAVERRKRRQARLRRN